MNDLPNMRHASAHCTYAAHDTCPLKRYDAPLVYTCPLRHDFCRILLTYNNT
jgi:hypothetical protein